MGAGLFILQCFYLMLPAYFANMAPVMVKKINFLAIPIDGGKVYNKKPLFGKNKTWRGLFFGTLFGIITAYIQFRINATNLNLIDYTNWLAFGALSGMGAILGDLVESFIKRRLNRKPGQKFFPWDQTDFVFGSLLLTYVFIPTLGRWTIIWTIILISPILHIVVNHSAFYLKIRNEKW